MSKLILALALITAPSLAFAGRHGGGHSTAHRNADAARKSAAAHAAKGNSSAARNMAKIAESRQKAADRAARNQAKKR